MQYNENAQLDSSQMAPAGGGGGRRSGGLALGGGAAVLVAILAMVFGINPNSILGGSTDTAQSQAGTDYWAKCKTGSDIAADRECRFVAYTNSIQSYWKGAYGNYEMTQTKIFSGQTATGCGTATAAVGPFYCPVDKIVYLDESFFDDMLKGQLGAAGGDAAEAYVIAHEYGHHISDLTGVLSQVQSAGVSQAGAKSGQVRLELQADCYAGVWLKNATKDPASPIKAITVDDVNRAVDAAIAVGDDRIQMESTGSVSPESWTHGSSQMRKYWLAQGFNDGDPNKCNTFAADARLG